MFLSSAKIPDISRRVPEECGIANLSIGQGTILVTPLQITSLMNCIASGGIRQPLKILMPETEQDLTKYGVCPDIVRENEKKAGGKTRVISEETAESLLSMMNDTVRTGTQSPSRNIRMSFRAERRVLPRVSCRAAR